MRVAISKGFTKLGAFLYMKTEAKMAAETYHSIINYTMDKV